MSAQARSYGTLACLYDAASSRLRDATLPSMGKTRSAQLFILHHHVGARVRADRRSRSGLARRACHLEETPPRRPTARPVASPAQWSPGSSPDLWCKSFIYSLFLFLFFANMYLCRAPSFGRAVMVGVWFMGIDRRSHHHPFPAKCVKRFQSDSV